MPRLPKGDKPMTSAQKQRERRERLKAQGLKEHLVLLPDTDIAKAAITKLAAKLTESHMKNYTQAHIVNIYPEQGNPFKVFFSTEEKAHEFIRQEQEYGRQAAYWDREWVSHEESLHIDAIM